MALYEMGCLGGDELCCDDLGDVYAKGLAGIPRDNANARSYYQQSCDGGYDLGCTHLKELR